MSEWIEKTHVNDYTGATQQIWRKTTRTGAGHIVQYQVYETGGRYYWSANILVKNRPDLTHMAYGTYAATPQALAVAKMRASRCGMAALRAAQQPRHLTRAA